MGMKQGPKPQAGKDTRPWGVERDGEMVVRCWYKSTAQKWVEDNGGRVRRIG